MYLAGSSKKTSVYCGTSHYLTKRVFFLCSHRMALIFCSLKAHAPPSKGYLAYVNECQLSSNFGKYIANTFLFQLIDEKIIDRWIN